MSLTLLKKGISSFYVQSVRSELHMLEEVEYASAEGIDRLQRERLNKLLCHAYRHVPYYREMMERSGVAEAGTVHADRFDRLHFLTKDDLREQFERLKSDDLSARDWYHNASGGSTGEPTRFIQDTVHRRWGRALKLHFNRWTGYEMGSPRIRLWGSERDLFEGGDLWWKRVKRWAKNEVALNAFKMSRQDMGAYVKTINRHQPVQIIAYVESLYELAKFIRREKLRVHSPKAIMTSAGTLFPEMRVVMQEVFDAPVFDRYGSREVSDMACECECHEGLHISPLTHYVEVVDANGDPVPKGQPGEVVVTSLVNYAMPFLRYKIGDIAVFSESACSCGRNWPLLERVSGRVTDVFRKKDGGIVVPEYFIHMFGVVFNEARIKRFQIVQENIDLIRIKVMPVGGAATEGANFVPEKRAYEKKVQFVMGADCSVEVEVVPHIAPSPSGKYRYTLSKIRATALSK